MKVTIGFSTSNRMLTEAAKYPTSVFTMPNMPMGWCDSESCTRPMDMP